MFDENQADTATETNELKYHYDRDSLEVQITEVLFAPVLIFFGLSAALLLVISGLMS